MRVSRVGRFCSFGVSGVRALGLGWWREGGEWFVGHGTSRWLRDGEFFALVTVSLIF